MDDRSKITIFRGYIWTSGPTWQRDQFWQGKRTQIEFLVDRAGSEPATLSDGSEPKCWVIAVDGVPPGPPRTPFRCLLLGADPSKTGVGPNPCPMVDIQTQDFLSYV
jgi:hypothetical protein